MANSWGAAGNISRLHSDESISSATIKISWGSYKNLKNHKLVCIANQFIYCH